MIRIEYFVIILVKSSLFLRILQRFAPMFHMVTGPGQAQELLVGHVNYWQKGCIVYVCDNKTFAYGSVD